MLAAFFVASTSLAQPDWSRLERYQETMTADTFGQMLNEVFSPDGGIISYLAFGPGKVSIFSTVSHTGAPLFELRFAAEDVAPPEPREIAGLHIALDPGHIGGAWSRMEERFFLVDRQRDWPVQEAAMNLYVARLIRDRLEAAGARVTLVKDDFDPMSATGPDALLAQSTIDDLPPPDARFAHLPELFVHSSQQDQLRKRVERQFYRTAEIAARARRINEDIQPDLTLCIHFNATGYGDEKTLHEENGLAFFVHGNYLARELESDDQKFFLLNKLLERSHDLERELAGAIATSFVAATGLPPAYRVEPGGVMHPVGTNHYIYARNLAANRQFAGPVIFLEPYFMNNRDTYARIQAGDYEGTQDINGTPHPSIFREYATAVSTAIIHHFSPENFQ
jgi:N-acetylmuramoyl-L-alanine amidase